jgi:MOSC domain-containing protein YiiM
MATLKGIAIRKKSKQPMVTLSSTSISCEFGVANDLRGKPGRRQVTVMSEESWLATCKEVNTELPWTARRANLLVSGISFSKKDVGRIIAIGDMQLRIIGEAAPCHWMDKTHSGLRSALTPEWRGGVCCQVICAGKIAVGDIVKVNESD